MAFHSGCFPLCLLFHTWASHLTKGQGPHPPVQTERMDAVPRVTWPTLTLAKPWPGAFSQHPLSPFSGHIHTTLTHTLTYTHTPPAMGMPASRWLSSPLPAPSHASWECDSRGLPRAQEEELGLHTSWGPRRQRGQVGEVLL